MEMQRGLLGRVFENALGWVVLGLILAAGVAIWQMPSETKQAIWSGAWRTALWLGLSAGLPWVARLFIRRILETGSNWAGAALIAALTVGNALLGLVLAGGFPSGGWGWLASLALLGAAALYNFLVTEYLAEMAGG
jgi:hypothetical protein